MGLKIIPINCPNCGAAMNIEEGRTQAFCTYCGGKVLINNENEHIIRTIDEAAIKQAETDRIIRLKEFEVKEKKSEQTKKIMIAWIIATAVLMILGIVGFATNNFGLITCLTLAILSGVLGAIFLKNEQEKKDGKIKLPQSVIDFRTKDYRVIERELSAAGFANIQCIVLNDLMIGLFKKPGIVESLSVNGETIALQGARFMPDVPIIISYHDFVDKK